MGGVDGNCSEREKDKDDADQMTEETFYFMFLISSVLWL